MSDVRLVVRGADRDWSGTLHGGIADRAVAALSADPMTLAELEVAYSRYATPDPNRGFFGNLSPGLLDEPYDAGIVVIDLVARLVVVDCTYFSPLQAGEVAFHDGQCETDTWLPFHLANDWLFTSDGGNWLGLSESRRRERAARPRFDARGVLYGRALLEFLAREIFAAFERHGAIAAPGPAENPTSRDPTGLKSLLRTTFKQIHADWLLTPREDLGGACPREVAMEWHEHLSLDMQNQCQCWSTLGASPPGLDPSSFAYRHGGFGTHELVQHYHLVRSLLASCWRRRTELSSPDASARSSAPLTVDDFVAREIPRLEGVRDEWLDSPYWEHHARTPRSIIERERARLPEAMSGEAAMVDEDCPCCQMLGDVGGLMFWNLDGSTMEDEFAFDIQYRTREEWDEDQLDWDDFGPTFDAETEERKRTSATQAENEQPIWNSSSSAADTETETEEVSPEVRLFGIAAHLSELVSDIRAEDEAATAAPDARRVIDQLNRDFGNLRDILQSTEPSRGEALLQPVIERFSDSLSAVAQARPGLSRKCEALTRIVAGFLNAPDDDWDWGTGDDDELD